MSRSTKQKSFSITDRKRTIFFIGVFVFGLVTFVIVYPKTMMSFKELFILGLLFLCIDILVIKLKTKLNQLPAFIALCISVLLAQFSILLLLNRITIGNHIEKHRIINTSRFDYGLILELENKAYSDFFSPRFIPTTAGLKHKDTITYHFSDGLLGFKILDKVE